MEMGWSLNIYSEDVSEEDAREVGRKYLDGVSSISERWEVDMNRVLDVNISVGAFDYEGRINAELSSPDVYTDEMVQKYALASGAEQVFESYRPLPIHEMSESAAHLVSEMPHRRLGDGIISTTAISEIFGALGIGYEEPVLLENERQIMERNLELIDQVYEEAEVSDVKGRVDELVQHQRNIKNMLENGEEPQTVLDYNKNSIENILGGVERLKDVTGYSRDQYLFGTFEESFIRTYGSLNPVPPIENVEADSLVDQLEESISELQQVDQEGLERSMEVSKSVSTIEDRAYLISRVLAQGILENETGDVSGPGAELEVEDLEGRDLVHMSNDEIEAEIGDEIQRLDDVIRDEYSLVKMRS